MQPAEIQFAQRLASHEKGVRERAARRLRQYLSVKTQRETGGFSHEELLKIWKGLFYCMWVQDEPLLQEELAVTISHLVHAVNNSEAQRLFLQTFWQTLNREWAGIDGPRLDKYHTLIRLVLRQSLEVLKRNSWEESRIQLFLDVLMKEVLHPESQAPNGVKFHFIDIYLDELSAVGGKELPADQNLKLIDPLCRIAAKTKDHMLVQTIARAVLEAVIHRSPLAPEETVAGQQAEAAGTRGAAPGRCPSRSDGAREGGAGHAGSPEDEGRLLQFDYKAVADRLLEMTSRKNTPPFNRKWLSRLVQKFQGLSEAGHVVQLSLAEDEDDGRAPGRGAHKRKRGSEPGQACGSENQRGDTPPLAEEDGGAGTHKRKRKRRKKSHGQPQHAGPGGEAEAPGPDQGGEPEAAELGPGQPPKHRRQRPRKRGLRGPGQGPACAAAPPPDLSRGAPDSGLTPEPAAPGSPACGPQSPKKPCQLGVPPARCSSLPQKEGPPGAKGDSQRLAPERGVLKKRKGQPGSLDPGAPAGPSDAVLRKGKKAGETSTVVARGRLMGPGVRRPQARGGSGALGPSKQQPSPEAGFVRFGSPVPPKALFCRRAKSAAPRAPGPAAQLKAPPSSKKVTFGLSRNMTAEFRKTDRSILVSPEGLSRVAFNPEQRPLHGVLKTPTGSPASPPLGPRKLPAAVPSRRPRAVDFF